MPSKLNYTAPIYTDATISRINWELNSRKRKYTTTFDQLWTSFLTKTFKEIAEEFQISRANVSLAYIRYFKNLSISPDLKFEDLRKSKMSKIEIENQINIRYKDFKEFFDKCTEYGLKFKLNNFNTGARRQIQVNGFSCYMHLVRAVYQGVKTQRIYYRFVVNRINLSNYKYQIIVVNSSLEVRIYIVPSLDFIEYLNKKGCDKSTIYISSSDELKTRTYNSINFRKYLNNYSYFKPA